MEQGCTKERIRLKQDVETDELLEVYRLLHMAFACSLHKQHERMADEHSTSTA